MINIFNQTFTENALVYPGNIFVSTTTILANNLLLSINQPGDKIRMQRRKAHPCSNKPVLALYDCMRDCCMCECACIFVCVFVFLCIWIYICVCTYTCVWVAFAFAFAFASASAYTAVFAVSAQCVRTSAQRLRLCLVYSCVAEINGQV